MTPPPSAEAILEQIEPAEDEKKSYDDGHPFHVPVLKVVL